MIREPIWPWGMSPGLLKNENDFSISIYGCYSSEWQRMLSWTLNVVSTTDTVCELSEVLAAFWIHALHWEFARLRPRALCLCTTLEQRVKLQSPCLSHLTWPDLTTKTEKALTVKQVKPVETQHIMNMEIIGNKCNNISVSSFSRFGCFYAFKVQIFWCSHWDFWLWWHIYKWYYMQRCMHIIYLHFLKIFNF